MATPKKPLSVWDLDNERQVLLDVSECQCWGPVELMRDWDSTGGYFEVYGDAELYRHPTGDWTLVEELTHVEVNVSAGLTATRISEEHALRWLVTHGFDLTRDLAVPGDVLEELTFRPGPPASGQERRLAAASSPLPQWDKDAGELTRDGAVIRKVKPTAHNLRKILACFQEDTWPRRIDSPFSDDEAGKQALRETVRELNKKLTQIQFVCDGSGAGIEWKPRSEDDKSNPPF
jgi:hypothetical protein